MDKKNPRKISERLNHLMMYLRLFFWEGPLRGLRFVWGVRKTKKALLPAFLLLAHKNNSVYLVVDGDDQENIVCITIDPKYLTQDRVEEWKGLGYDIIKIEKLY